MLTSDTTNGSTASGGSVQRRFRRQRANLGLGRSDLLLQRSDRFPSRGVRRDGQLDDSAVELGDTLLDSHLALD